MIAMISAINAQPRAIGGRIGGDFEFSYQHMITSNWMVDLTAGANGYFSKYGSFGAACMFDWVGNIRSGWNWYVGPGFGVGWNWNEYYGNSPIRINVGGQIGIEYQFGFPLNLSLDWRPMWNFLGFGSHYFGDLGGVAFGVRYRF